MYNLDIFIPFYHAIKGVFAGKHQEIFKSKAKEGPFAEAPGATKLSRGEINAAFAQYRAMKNPDRDPILPPRKGRPSQRADIAHKEIEPLTPDSQPTVRKVHSPKAQPPSASDEFVIKFLGILDNPGIIFAPSFWDEANKEKKKEFHEKKTEENNEPLETREYANIETIKRFQEKVDSNFKKDENKEGLESKNVPFLIPIEEGLPGGVPSLSSIQEKRQLTEQLREIVNSKNKIIDSKTNQSNLNTKSLRLDDPRYNGYKMTPRLVVGNGHTIKKPAIGKDDPIFKKIMREYVIDFSKQFEYSNDREVDGVVESLVNSKGITPDDLLDAFDKRGEYDKTIAKLARQINKIRKSELQATPHFTQELTRSTLNAVVPFSSIIEAAADKKLIEEELERKIKKLEKKLVKEVNGGVKVVNTRAQQVGANPRSHR